MGARHSTSNGNGSGPAAPPPPARKPKLKKLRLMLILTGLAVLALVSTVFGMLMAVSSDLPSLENQAEFRAAENSRLYSDGPGCREPGNAPCQIAKLTGNQNRILLREGEISPNIKNAVIAVEDQRFYEHEGVDYTGIGRALVQDVLKRRAAQGGSTITQQFVKNALSAQADRTVFQKLRESALAYHLERQWPKEKILTQYLNTVYFGNGAYGIEAAVRTYFGDGDEPDELAAAENASGVQYAPPPVDGDEPDPNAREATDVTPAEAAMLAGLIASPSLYDPVVNPRNATARRNLVLTRMYEQGMITKADYEENTRQSVPDEDEVDPPTTESEQPYFTSWMTQQLVDRYRPGRVFGGGLKIKTTIDPEMQAAAENRGGRPPRGRRARRLAGGHREPDGRGQGHGRRLELQRPPLQPGHQRAPPAGLIVQALHPRARARRRDRPQQRLGLAAQAAALPRARRDRSCSRCRTTRTPTWVPPRCGRPRRRRTTRCSPSWAWRSSRSEWPAWPTGWGSAPSSPPTRPCCSAVSSRA